MKKNIIFSVLLLSINTSSSIAKFYSQTGQDKYLYNTFFKNTKKGVFVDIGAHDGITYSNSAFFEKELGWHGMCIEPLPKIFKKLKNNRNCICINGCIADSTKVAEFLSIEGYSEMLSGLVENYHPLHLQRIDSELAIYGGKKEVITVQCYRLKDILEQYNITHIDFVSIDTEGNELDILKSIDFSTIYIDIICVENNYNDPNFNKYLARYNYKLITKLGADEIYQKIK